MNKMNRIVEIFVDVYIDDIPTVYMISDAGRVMNKRTRKILKPALNKRGYEIYRLYIDGDTKCSKSGHRLVATAFLPNYDDKRTVNHIDGDKRNNDVSNLEWATDHEQMQHAIKIGLRSFDHFKGSKNVNFRYSDEIVHEVCQLLESGTKPSIIARKYGMTKSLIRLIVRGDVRKDISSQYNIDRECKLTYYSDKLKSRIADLLNKGMTYRDIVEELKLPKKQASYSLISYVRSKYMKK